MNGFHITTERVASRIEAEGFRGSVFAGLTKAGEYDANGVVFCYPSLNALRAELEMWGESVAVFEVHGDGFDWQNPDAFNPNSVERIFPVESISDFRLMDRAEWE
jgi:hypothetical protein